MKNTDKFRYVTLLGDRVRTPLAQIFIEAADIQASLAATAAALCLGSLDGQATALTTVSDVFYDNFSRAFIWRFINTNSYKRKFAPNNMQDKCIDTKPNENTPNTLPKYLSGALSSRSYATKFLCLFLASEAFCIALALNEKSDPHRILTAAKIFLNNISLLTRFISDIDRFNKIAQGDYVIVDVPPPAPPKEKQSMLQSLRRLLPSPT